MTAIRVSGHGLVLRLAAELHAQESMHQPTDVNKTCRCFQAQQSSQYDDDSIAIEREG